jgi:hypothetical protein
MGPLTAGTVANFDVMLYGSSGNLCAGRVVRAGGDVDGDGVGDVVLQASTYWCVAGHTADGTVIVARGPFPVDLDLVDADAWLVGGENELAGAALAQADVDGDGLADTLVGAPSGGATLDGRAYVVSGPTTGTIDLADAADVVVNGTHAGRLGTALTAGDVDGDGQTDLVVGAPYESTITGATYVFHGPMTGEWDDTAASSQFLGNAEYDNAGTAVALADLDANGRMDLLIGAPVETTSAVYAGALYIWMSD